MSSVGGMSVGIASGTLIGLRGSGVHSNVFSLVRRIVAEGHELANHGYDHGILVFRGPGHVAEQIRRTEHAVAAAVGAEDPTALVGDLVRAGHTVLVETTSGIGSHYPDAQYAAAGAEITATMEEVYARAELICEVKEPQPSEYACLRPGLALFTYLHLAPLPELTDKLLEAKVTAIAYETVTSPHGTLPLLTPMSEIAGRLAPQAGAAAGAAAPPATGTTAAG